jgi:hypothetical protein
MAQDDMIGDWADLAALATGRFEPTPFYDEEGDSLTLFVSDEESYGQDVHPYVMLYRSRHTGAVTGCHLRSVRRRLVTAMRSFHVGLDPDSITLGLLLLAVPMAEEAGSGGTPADADYRAAILPLSQAAGGMRVRIPA